MDSATYWKNREAEQRKHNIQDEAEYQKHIREIYQNMIDEIENQIFNMEEKEVQTSVIGELVMKKLQMLDEVAYVRFASVYREFKDVNTFIEEIGKLLKK